MFFRKLFSKDYRYYLEKADRQFAEGHFAEARNCYRDAWEKLADGPDRGEQETYLKERLARTGDSLALLNIEEAAGMFRNGNPEKASEYLELALELAEDGMVREKAENLMRELAAGSKVQPTKPHSHGKHSCTGCTPAHHALPDNSADSAMQLVQEEQFHLLTQPLPDDLPVRYAALGKKFAYAYLLAHEDRFDEALVAYEELLAQDVNDILLYETALIYYRNGNRAECQKRLEQSLSYNPHNALCHLSMAHLYIDTGRLAEAVGWLQAMLERGILPEQAMVMLGDVYQAMGRETDAIDIFGKALEIPALKKIAAERLVPILGSQGRTDEANFLVKNYLKGCC